uniref:H15 domain-containing protein n=1 Tax=Salvator merianae TaxID=96440 RepID=A0A8D0E9L7_SALMN
MSATQSQKPNLTSPGPGIIHGSIVTGPKTQRAARQFNQSRAIAPKPPTTNLSLLILTAVATCRKKSGLSMQALKKIVTNMGYDMDKKKHYFLRSIKSMVAKGQLWQVKGTGATGSFKVNPDIGKKKHQPKVRGRGQKPKDATKKKDGLPTSRRKIIAKVKQNCDNTNTGGRRSNSDFKHSQHCHSNANQDTTRRKGKSKLTLKSSCPFSA